MRGRRTFAIFKPILYTVSAICRLFPAGFCNWLLERFRYCRGYAGVGVRYVLIRRLARSCGNNVSVREAIYLFDVCKLRVGNNVSMHPMCYIDAKGGLTIGDDVSIGHNVSILSFEHEFSETDRPIKDAPCLAKQIVIENDVYIGAGARILGGVKIGTGTVIGAGAVVTNDVPAMSVAVGVPARVIKSRKPQVTR